MSNTQISVFFLLSFSGFVGVIFFFVKSCGYSFFLYYLCGNLIKFHRKVY